MRFLGVDPGSLHTGYGVVEVAGRAERVLEFGVIDLPDHLDHTLRLEKIYADLTAVIERTLPDECAVEMPVYGQNAQSMLKLGRAQAAVMLAAIHRQLPVVQYTPKEVKKAVTGNGNATKEQVWFMIRALLNLPEADKQTWGRALDASDALAVALCHAHRRQRGSTGSAKNWKQFVAAHPGRVIG